MHGTEPGIVDRGLPVTYLPDARLDYFRIVDIRSHVDLSVGKSSCQRFASCSV